MRAFRFRAEAALQLRRRQHEQELVRQAAAERALREADRVAEAAAAAIRDADARLDVAVRGTVDGVQLRWHLAWRTRCVNERARVDAQRMQRRVELEHVRQQVSESYRRVRSLEQLREHALSEWAHLAQLEERKAMDALAGSQYVRRKDD